MATSASRLYRIDPRGYKPWDPRSASENPALPTIAAICRPLLSTRGPRLPLSCQGPGGNCIEDRSICRKLLGLFFWPPAALLKGDTYPLCRAAGRNPGAIRLTYFATSPRSGGTCRCGRAGFIVKHALARWRHPAQMPPSSQGPIGREDVLAPSQSALYLGISAEIMRFPWSEAASVRAGFRPPPLYLAPAAWFGPRHRSPDMCADRASPAVSAEVPRAPPRAGPPS